MAEPVLCEEPQLENIVQFLRVNVLIPLRNVLFSERRMAEDGAKSEEKSRMYLAIALTKLIAKLPFSTFRIEFPKIINQVVKYLKNKDQKVRDRSRQILSEVLTVTGPYFFHYILSSMRLQLCHGWELHILNYTVYYLLQKLLGGGGGPVENGSLDYCLSEIFQLISEELFGQLQAEKQNEDIPKKMVEFKKNKAIEMMHLVAKSMNFRNSILSFFAFLRAKLQENLTDFQNQSLFEQLFHSALEGFKKNTSINAEDLLVLCSSLIAYSIEILEHAKKQEHHLDTTLAPGADLRAKKVHDMESTYGIEDVTAQNKSIFKKIQSQKSQNQFKIGTILSNFGLKLILFGINKGYFSADALSQSSELAGNFEAILKQILRCLDTQDNAMLQNCLRIFSLVLDWPIKFIAQQKEKITNSTLHLLEKLSVQTDAELIQDSFRLMTKLVEQGFLSNQKKITCILRYIKNFVEQSDFLIECLECFRAVVLKKIIIPEVYDMVLFLREKMITCYSKNYQSICKQIFLQFLVDFPLSDKLVQNHINFLVKNVEYQETQGRLLVCQVIRTVTEKFPKPVIDHWTEILFVALIVAYVKESDGEVISCIDAIFRELFSRMESEKIRSLAAHCLKWIQDDAPNSKILQTGFLGLEKICENLTDKQVETYIKPDSFSQRVIETLKRGYVILLEFRQQLTELKETKANLQQSAWTELITAQQKVIIDQENSRQLQALLRFIYKIALK